MNNIIYLNYGTSYKSNQENLDVGIHDIEQEKIIVKPNLFYNHLTPILHPENYNGIFTIDNNKFKIDEKGIISYDNLDEGIYTVNVTWTLNNVETTTLAVINIEPQFYYENNEKHLLFGTKEFSDKPIIKCNSPYSLSCNYRINDEGILDFSNFDVGYHNIIIKLNYKNNNSIQTNYHLYIKPIIKYDDYVFYAFNNSQTNIPYVSQLGGQFIIENQDNDFFKIENNGVIKVNAPSGIYKVKVIYTKNKSSNFCFVNFIVNPNIKFNNLVFNSNEIIKSEIPISNEIIDGVFEILNNTDIKINHQGIITFDHLNPGYYDFKIKYTKNNSSTITNIKVTVFPFLNILSLNDTDTKVYYEKDHGAILTCSNNDITIYDNYFIINTNKVGCYTYEFKLTYNKMITTKYHNFKLLPFFSYSKLINYTIYSKPFESEEPNLDYLIPTKHFYLDTIYNFNINSNTGSIYSDYLDVGEYNLYVHLNYLNFDVSTNFILIVKPLLEYSDININYLDQLPPIYFLPKNGILTCNLFDISDNIILNAGNYNCIFNYTVNNISSLLNININVNKKKIYPKFKIEDKEYDGTTDVKITCLNYQNVIVLGKYEDCNAGFEKDIIINQIIIPDNYYIDINKLKGNILKRKITPKIITEDKIFDNTTKVDLNITTDIEDFKIISYKANFISKNIGLQNVIISDIIIDSLNYKLSSDTYTVTANILPRNVIATFQAVDKVFNNESNCNVKLIKLENICPDDILYVINVESQIIDSNEVIIKNYQLIGKNYNNYTLSINKMYINILPTSINLNIIAESKIYDNTTKANVIFNTNYKIISYVAEYFNKNVGFNKKIRVSNIVFEDKNYITGEYIIYGSILPKNIELSFIGNDKEYDKSNACTGNYYLSVCENDIVSATFDVEFKDLNSGNNKELVITNIKLNKDNYKVASVNTNCPNIYKKEIKLDFECIDKMYDKTLEAFVRCKNKDITIVELTAEYEDYNVGTNKKIIIKNIKLEPNIELNYYASDSFCYGNIIPRELSLILNEYSKVYDGSFDADVTINHIKNIVDNDQVYIESLDSVFIDNYIINITDIVLQGNDAYNYICKDFQFSSLLKPQKININFIAIDKIYDPKLKPDIICYDEKVLSYNCYYEDIKIGKQRIVIDNIKLNSDYHSADYHIIYGNILPIQIKLEFKLTNDKIYDGTKNVISIECTNNIGIHFKAEYEDANVGFKKIIISEIILEENYITDNEYIYYGNIMPKEIFINPKIKKIFDGTDSYNLIDDSIISCKCRFSDVNVGKNIPVFISDIKLKDNNYFIKDFVTYGSIESKLYEPTFIVREKTYDGTNKAFFKYVDNEVKSFKAYYVGNQINIEDIELKNSNYKSNNIVLYSSIKPKLLEIEFFIKPKIYDKNDIATIDSYTLLNTNENINILSYEANYENTNVGNQNIIIKNVILDSTNYITNDYVAKGIINPKELNLTFKNLDKIYDQTINTNIEIDTIYSDQVKLELDEITIDYFDSSYDTPNCGSNNIIVSGIHLVGPNAKNYFVKEHKIKGNIFPKPINCNFSSINGRTIVTLDGILNGDNIYISNYTSNGDVQLDGKDINNYIYINKNI
jgi:hypothetical protein